jgi:hypothetical protein
MGTSTTGQMKVRIKIDYPRPCPTHNIDFTSELLMLYPKIRQEIERTIQGDKFATIHLRKFQDLKDRLILIKVCLDKQQALKQPARETTIKSILDQGHPPRKDSPIKKGLFTKVFSFMTASEGFSSEEELLKQTQSIISVTSDVDFLSDLSKRNLCDDPLLGTAVKTAFDLAHQHIREWIKKQLTQLVLRSQHIQDQECKSQLRSIETSRRAERHRISAHLLVQDMRGQSQSLPCVIYYFHYIPVPI